MGEKWQQIKTFTNKKNYRRMNTPLKQKGGLAGQQTVSCGRRGGLSLPGRKCLGFIGFI